MCRSQLCWVDMYLSSQSGQTVASTRSVSHPDAPWNKTSWIWILATMLFLHSSRSILNSQCLPRRMTYLNYIYCHYTLFKRNNVALVIAMLLSVLFPVEVSRFVFSRNMVCPVLRKPVVATSSWAFFSYTMFYRLSFIYFGTDVQNLCLLCVV